jgi:hypothetical protein
MLHASQITMHGHHLQIRDQWINTVGAHLIVLSASAFLVLECCRKSLMTRPTLNTHWYEQGAKGKEKKRFKRMDWTYRVLSIRIIFNCRPFIISSIKVGVSTLILARDDALRGSDPLLFPSSILEVCKFVSRV